jgi:hypothetical protein
VCQHFCNGEDRDRHNECGEQAGRHPHRGKQEPRRHAQSPPMCERQREGDAHQVHPGRDAIEHDHVALTHHALVSHAESATAEPTDLEPEIGQGARDRAVSSNQPQHAHVGHSPSSRTGSSFRIEGNVPVRELRPLRQRRRSRAKHAPAGSLLRERHDLYVRAVPVGRDLDLRFRGPSCV